MSIFDKLKFPSASQKVQAQFPVQILGIFRYTYRPQVLRLVGFDGDDKSLEGTEDMFDLILSDGSQKVKIVLFPILNTWITSGDIQVLDTIYIRKWKAHQVPGSGRIYPVLENFTRASTGNTSVVFANRNTPITWHSEYMLMTGITKPFAARPMLPIRRVYISPYIDDCLPFAQCSPLFTNVQAAALAQALSHYEEITHAATKDEEFQVTVDDVWNRESSSDGSISVSEEDDLNTLHDVLSKTVIPADAASILVTDQVLVGKVVKKGPVIYFGEATVDQVLPVKFEIVLGDQSRTVQVSLWNSICTKYFTRISPGLVVAIRCFRLKRNGEVSLNSHPNKAKVSEVDVLAWNDHATERLMVPVVNTIFTASSVMDNAQYRLTTKVEMDKHCCCLGIITFLGRLERCTGFDGNSYGYRWIRLRDNTSTRDEIVIQLYVNSQYDIISGLEVGKVFLATNLKMCTTLSSSNIHQLPLSVCMRSTKYSSYFLDAPAVTWILAQNVTYPKQMVERCTNLLNDIDSEIVSDEFGNVFLTKNLYETTLHLTPFFSDGSLRPRFSVVPRLITRYTQLTRLEANLSLGEHISVRVKARLDGAKVDSNINPSRLEVRLNASGAIIPATVRKDHLFTRHTHKLVPIVEQSPMETLFNYFKLVFDPLESNTKSLRSRKRKRIRSDFDMMRDLEKTLEEHKVEDKIYWISLFRSPGGVERVVKGVF